MKTCQVIECGCCGGFHRRAFGGDCRDDNERFDSLGDAATRLNIPVVEVWEDENGQIDGVSPYPVIPGDLDN